MKNRLMLLNISVVISCVAVLLEVAFMVRIHPRLAILIGIPSAIILGFRSAKLAREIEKLHQGQHGSSDDDAQ